MNGTRAPIAAPTSIRSLHGSGRLLRLSPRPPFRLDLTVWALRRREQNTIDRWDGRTYRRALLIGRRRVAVAVTQTGTCNAPQLEISITGRALPASIDSVVDDALTGLLGVEIDLSDFYARAARDSTLGPLAARFRGLKPPRFPTLFECLLNAVACQQLSLAAGLTVLSRLAAAAARPAGTLHPFPAPGDVLRLSVPSLRELGFSDRKARTILQLARAADDGELDLDRFESLGDEDVVRALMQRPGIGRWSADYVLLRGLGRLHVFPPTDVGAMNGLRRFLEASGLDDDPTGGARSLEARRRRPLFPPAAARARGARSPGFRRALMRSGAGIHPQRDGALRAEHLESVRLGENPIDRRLGARLPAVGQAVQRRAGFLLGQRACI